jgi:hypothetical protein
MKKRSWHFKTVGDIYGGSVIFDREVDAEEALRECRLSLGCKVNRVY